MSPAQEEDSSLQTSAAVPRYHAPFLTVYSKMSSITEISFEEVELLLITEMAMSMENGRADLLLTRCYHYFIAVIGASEIPFGHFLRHPLSGNGNVCKISSSQKSCRSGCKSDPHPWKLQWSRTASGQPSWSLPVRLRCCSNTSYHSKNFSSM